MATRLVHVDIRDENGARFSGPVTQIVDDTEAPTPVDCVLSDWGDWTNSGSPGPCINGLQSQVQIRTRTVVTPPENNGATCGPLTEQRTVFLDCEIPEEPEIPAITFTKTGDGAVRGEEITGTPNLPSLFWLHATGGTAQSTASWGDLWEYEYPTSLANYPDPNPPLIGKFTIEENANFIRIRPADHITNPRNGVVWPLWWIGITENGVANRFVEKRLDAILEHCITTYNLDATRIALGGVSLGGRGTLTYGLRRYSKFSVLFPLLPDWNIARIPDLENGSKVTLYPTPVLDEDGVSDYYPTVDMLNFLRNTANPSRWLMWAIGQYDGAAPWSMQLEALSILRSTRRAHAFAWNGGDHSGYSPASGALTSDYPYTIFATDQSHPAFFNSSIDDDPNVMVGVRQPGDNSVWGVNLGFEWRNVVDTAGTWSCEISNSRATEEMTVEVMPYNCQTFATVVDPKEVTIPLGQWASVSFTDSEVGEEPDPEPEPEPGEDFDPQITKQAMINTALVMFTTFHSDDGERYDRWQLLTELHGTSTELGFWKQDLEAGGVRIPFTESTYTLRVDGLVATTASVTAGVDSESAFTLDLTDIADGWHRFSIDVGPLESSPDWFMYVNKENGPVSQWPTMPVCTGSYPIAAYNSPHFTARVPARYTPWEKPLVPRECPSFDTALSRTLLHRENLAACHHNKNPLIPCVSRNGVMGTMNMQAYNWSTVIKEFPDVVLLDGERGVGTVVMPTHIQVDRHGGAYCCDPWRVFRVSPTGKVTTRAGFRHRVPAGYYNDPPDLELIGDWSGVPEALRKFWEIWGMAFDLNSLALDEEAEPILNSVNGELEQPHLIGPRLFVASSQNGTVFLLTFQKDDFNAEPVVTVFLTGLNDPWDCVWHDNVLYVSERQAHRINAYNATTGAFIRTVVSGPALAVVNTSRVMKPISGKTFTDAQGEDVVAPEGLFIQDGWLYYGSYAMRQIKRINLTTNAIEVVIASVYTTTVSKYVKFALSDGTFGPRGTVFTSTWQINERFGMPFATLPDGTKWIYNSSGHPTRGKGGNWESTGYTHAPGIGLGRLICGSVEYGLVMISKALDSDPTIDVAKYVRGKDEYTGKGYHLVYGYDGWGYQGLPLPWGESVDMDYYLTTEGHSVEQEQEPEEPEEPPTGLPGFNIATLQPGQMRRIPDTKLVDALDANGKKVIEWLNHPVTGELQAWPGGAGNVREHSIMLAESGAALSIPRREIYHTGGGHQDGAHSGLYAFKFALPGDTITPSTWKWRRAISHPQLFEGAQNYPLITSQDGHTYNPDGTPASRHTWGGITYNGVADKVWIALGSTWPIGKADPLRLSWNGNVDTGEWVESFPLSASDGLTSTFGANYSPTLQKIFWTYQHNIMMHDPVTGEDRPVNGDFGINSQAHSIIDDAGMALYVFYWNPLYIKRFDLSAIMAAGTPKSSRPDAVNLTPSGDYLAPLSTYRPAHAWSATHGHVCWIGGNDIYVAPLPDATYTKITLTGDVGPARVTQGSFGKFTFIDAAGTIGLIHTLVTNDTYVFRMP